MILQKQINTLIPYILVPALSFIVAGFITGGGSSVYTILLIIAAVCICFFIPSSLILYLIILLTFSARWLSDVLIFFPRQVTWIPDLLILLLLSRSFLKFVQAKASLRGFPYFWFLLGNISLLIVSLIVSGEKIILLLPAVKVYLKFIFLAFSIFILQLDVKIYKNCFKLLIVIVLVQIPVTVIQAFHAGTGGDYGGGTLGANSTGLLSVINGIFTCVFLENYFSSHKKKYFVAALSLFIPAIAGSAKFAFIVYPIIYLYYFVKYSNSPKTLLINIVSIGASALVFAGFINIFSKYDKGYTFEWFSSKPSGAYEYEMRVSGGEKGTVGRIGSLKYAIRLVADTNNIPTALFGYGACSSAESFLGPDFESKLYRSGAFKASMPAFPRLIVELGLFGLGFYLFFYYTLIRPGNNHFLNKICLLSIVGFFLISSFYVSTLFSDPTAIVFWLIICFMHKQVNRNNSIILLDNKKA